ncbi:hypothetical protein PFISCL1PPCAC_7397, partial [Pristionchus fissidentatus]
IDAAPAVAAVVEIPVATSNKMDSTAESFPDSVPLSAYLLRLFFILFLLIAFFCYAFKWVNSTQLNFDGYHSMPMPHSNTKQTEH